MKIILSIDGGGIRGIIPATILSYLENKIHEITNDNRIKISSLIDFISGTSTGSIIGSLMLIPDENNNFKYKMSEIIDFYLSLGNNVFKHNFIHNIKTIFGLFGPSFPDSNIDTPLLKLFDHYKMNDLLKPCMFGSYDIEKRKIMFFTNKDLNQKYINYNVKDIIRGSTSIPSYFTPAHFNNGTSISTLIDGGLFANNPSLASFIESSKTCFDDKKPKQHNPKDILIISLGCGKIDKKSYSYNKIKNWGKAKWIIPLFEILLSSNSEITDYEIRQLFISYDSIHNYKRINPPIVNASSSSMDSSKENLTNLIKDANQYIQDNKHMLDLLAREICDINFILKRNLI